MALRNSNSIRGKEWIARMYAALIDDEALYGKIRNRETIEWEQDEKQRLFLNKSLTLFDEMDSCCREIGKVRIGFFLLANAPVLTPKPEHVRADIESVGPRDDPVIDECLGEETFVDKRLGNRAVHVFDMALEIKFGYQAVFVGEGDLEIAVGSHRFKSWSHSNPSILLRGCIKPRNLQSSSSSAR